MMFKARLVAFAVATVMMSCGRVSDEREGVEVSQEALSSEPNGTCAHPLTTAGTKLINTCSMCASTICAADPYCCATAWDSLCVSAVPKYCTYPTSVVNGGFESGLTGWTMFTTYGTGIAVANSGRSGVASLSLSAAGQPGVRQKIQLGSATKLSIDVWYRTAPDANPVYGAGLIQASVYGVGSVACSPPISTVWAKYSCDFTKYAGQAITLTLYGNGNAVWFDDVALVTTSVVVDAGTPNPVDAGTPSCGPTNVTGPKQSPTCGACQATVCAKDGYCCSTSWDSICVSEALSWCGSAADAGGSPADAGTAKPVLNPSFENGLTSWSSAGSALIDSTSGLSIAGTSHLVLQPKPGVPAEVSQVIAMPSGSMALGLYFRPEQTTNSPATLHIILSAPGVATTDTVLKWTNGTWASTGLNVWGFTGKTTTVTIRALTTAATSDFFRVDQVQPY